LNVALTFNVKPESETFHEILSPNLKEETKSAQSMVDTYAEWDTWDTINAVKFALECLNEVTLVEANHDSFEILRKLCPDIVFNVAEGAYGVSREAQIPAMLDMLGIPYTGSDALTLAICLDKARTKEILSYYKIPTARFVAAETLSEVLSVDLNFPLIVKPVSEGSSKGIFSSSFVTNKKQLADEAERIIVQYNQAALIEEFLPGREFTVAVIGNGDESTVLPIIEISYANFPSDIIPIYSFEAKWILDTKENPLDVFSCPANVSKELEDQIKKTVLKTYNVLRCKDWSRIDVRLDKNNIPNIIEINPLPGILPNPEENSCFPKAARTAGLNYNDMINKVLFSAAKRQNLI